MSALDEPGFGLVRKAELDRIKTLKPRSRPRAIALMVAMRSILQRKDSGAFSDRDFRDFGMCREAAAGALKDCVEIGNLEILSKGSLTGRGHKTKYRIVHSIAGYKETAGKTDNSGRETKPFVEKTAGKPASSGRETKPFKKETAGKPDTTKETSSTSSQKSKEEEVSTSIEADGEAERLRKVEQDKPLLRSRLLACDAARMDWNGFKEKAGGQEAADFLVLRWASGKLTDQQLRSKLAENAEGFGRDKEEGPMVFTVAAFGGAA